MFQEKRERDRERAMIDIKTAQNMSQTPNDIQLLPIPARHAKKIMRKQSTFSHETINIQSCFPLLLNENNGKYFKSCHSDFERRRNLLDG